MKRRHEPSWDPTSMRGRFERAMVGGVFGGVIMGVAALVRWVASWF